MTNRETLWVLLFAAALPLQLQASGPIEPDAGIWRTWVISSGKDYRVPAPPNVPDTLAELTSLAYMLENTDAQERQQIAYWNAGSPAYRWIDLLNNRANAGTPITTNGRTGVYTYLALAMHDATIATWKSKYAYNRMRPGKLHRRLATVLPAPDSPSYPSEHAATAFAAAAVLGYFIPGEASAFLTLAEEAGWSRVRAGVQYPSDYYAGRDLGMKVAAAVIERAKADGSNTVWTGTVPLGTCKWTGSNRAT